MTSITPVSVPVIVSDYTRTHLEGDKVVYTRHVHEGSTVAGATGAKHKVLELGSVTYSRPNVYNLKETVGTIFDMKV